MDRLFRYVTYALSGALAMVLLFVWAVLPLHERRIAWSWKTLEVSSWWPHLMVIMAVFGLLLGVHFAQCPGKRKRLWLFLGAGMAGGWVLQELTYMWLYRHVSYEALWVYELQRPEWVELPLTLINAIPLVLQLVLLWWWVLLPITPPSQSADESAEQHALKN